MSVEVSCPGCGSKLKAPEERIGKKVRCKKCDTAFLVPAPNSPAVSPGESQAMSVLTLTPGLPPGDEDVPMAAAAEPLPPAAAPRQASDLSSLPSADPFDFSAPPAVKTAPRAAPAAKPAVPATPAPAGPARPTFGAARAKPPGSPPPAPPPVAKAPPPPAAPSPPARKPEPGPLPLDAEEVIDAPVESESEPEPQPASPFDFGADSEPAEPRSRGRRRSRDEEDDGDDEPRSRRRGRDRDEGEDEDEDDRPRGKGRRGNRDDDEDDSGPRRYRRAGEQKGGSTLLVSIILGVAAVGAMVAALIVYNQQQAKVEAEQRAQKEEQERKQKEREQKDKEAAEAEVAAQAALAGMAKPDPKGGKAEPPKKKEPGTTPKKNPGDTRPTKGEMLALAPTIPTLLFDPPSAKASLAHKASDPPVAVGAAPAKVKRVFPPADRRNNDAVVVWQSAAGAGGKGDRYSADVHSGSAGNQVGRVEFDGDGKDVKCDVSPDGKLFAAVGPDGKVSVWDLADKEKKKLLDGYDPYADKPDHKAAGVAAVFFTAAPKTILTVTTAGAAHLHDIDAKRSTASFGPLGALVPNRVALGKNVAADVTRTSIVLAVNGDIYQLNSATLAMQRTQLGGDVGRSLGIAVLGVPGRVVYAFETGAGGRKERAVLLTLPNEKPTTYRWPEAAGDPTGAAWAGAGLAVVSAEKGAVYIRADDEGKKFVPFAFAELAAPNAPQGATEDGHWYLTADPADPNRSLLVEVSTEAINDFYSGLEGKMPTVRLNEKGLWK